MLIVRPVQSNSPSSTYPFLSNKSKKNSVTAKQGGVLRLTSEQLPQIVVVRGLEEVQTSDVSQIGGKFLWVALAQNLDGSGSLGVANFLVSFLQSIRLESLPGKISAQEIHEHVTQSLQVVTSALLFPQVSIYRHVAGGSCQAFVLPANSQSEMRSLSSTNLATIPVGNMFVRVRVYVFLRQSEIHYVQSFVFFHARPTINKRFLSGLCNFHCKSSYNFTEKRKRWELERDVWPCHLKCWTEK